MRQLFEKYTNNSFVISQLSRNILINLRKYDCKEPRQAFLRKLNVRNKHAVYFFIWHSFSSSSENYSETENSVREAERSEQNLTRKIAGRFIPWPKRVLKNCHLPWNRWCWVGWRDAEVARMNFHRDTFDLYLYRIPIFECRPIAHRRRPLPPPITYS